MERGKLGVAVLFVLGFSAVAAAETPITINAPDQPVYTEDNARTINITADDPYNITNYTIPSADISRTVNNASVFDVVWVEDGRHTLFVSAKRTDGNGTAQAVQNVTIDTTGPQVTGKQPSGTIFDPSPTIDIVYEDAVHAVDNETVTIWLNDEQRTGNATRDRFTTDLDDIPPGTYNLSIRLADTVGNPARPDPQPPVSWQFTLPEDPVITRTGPQGLLDGTTADVTVTAKSPYGIDTAASTVMLKRGGETVAEHDWSNASVDGVTATFDHAFTELDDGTYTVTATVADNRSGGGETTDEWTFTVDTTAPEIELVSHADGDIVTGLQTFRAEATDALSGVDRVEFYAGDQRKTTSTGSDDRYQVNIDTAELADGEQAIDVYAYDTAGNQRHVGTDIVIDNTPPVIEDVTLVPDTFSERARLRATVEDAETGVRQVTYRLPDTDYSGALTPVDGELGEAGADADVRDEIDGDRLVPGEYTAVIRAEDAAGHVTEQETAVFTIDDAVTTELSIDAPGEVRLETGTETTVDVPVANTGDVSDIVSLSASGDLPLQVRDGEKEVNSGDRRSFRVRIGDATGIDPGLYTVTATAHGLTAEDTAEFTVAVQPDAARQEQIASEVAALADRLDALQASKEEYQSAVEVEDADEQFSDASDAVSRAEELIDDGKYYRAAQQLDDAEESVESADTAVTGMMTAYERQQRIALLAKLLAVMLLFGAVVGVYRWWPTGDGGFETGDGYVHRPDDRHPARAKFETQMQRMQERWTPSGSILNLLEDSDDEHEPERGDGWTGFDPDQ